MHGLKDKILTSDRHLSRHGETGFPLSGPIYGIRCLCLRRRS